MKIPDAKAAVDKEWEKLEKCQQWQMTKVKSKNRSHSESTNIAKNSPFYLEEWLRVGEDSTGDLEKILLRQFPTANISAMVRSSENPNCTVKHKQPMEALSAPRPMAQPDAPTWELLGPEGTASFWEITEAPLPQFYSPESAQFLS